MLFIGVRLVLEYRHEYLTEKAAKAAEENQIQNQSTSIEMQERDWSMPNNPALDLSWENQKLIQK